MNIQGKALQAEGPVSRMTPRKESAWLFFAEQQRGQWGWSCGVTRKERGHWI